MCKDVAIPYNFLMRNFYHQRHSAGQYCVMGIFALDQSSDRASMSTEGMKGTSITKDGRIVRLIQHHDFCNDNA